MARIRAKHTGLEVAVRRLLHSLGYRYRIHAHELPGTPDICFPRRKKAIFVHGCFWHRHDGCARTTTPKTRTSFWEDKFRKNVVRDQRNITHLAALSWDVLVVWECDTRNLERLARHLAEFLDGHPESVPPRPSAHSLGPPSRRQ